MSSLWIKVIYKKINLKKIMPSPANNIGFVHKPLSQLKYKYRSVKRMSLFLSPKARNTVSGSMTIEAAIIIPLILFLILHLSSCIEMLRLHSRIEAALWYIGNQMTVYAGAPVEVLEEIPDIGISYLYIHRQLQSDLGKNYLNNSPIVYGEDGFNYLMSDYLDEDDCIDMVVSYWVKPALTIFPFGIEFMYNRCYARAWTGFDVAADSEAGKVRYVYVTTKGEVWHAVADCSYLYHQVLSIPQNLIGSRKNESGRFYEECELCQESAGSTDVYYTAEGEKYHHRRDCSAIFKRVRAIEWEEKGGYRACSRCVSEEDA